MLAALLVLGLVLTLEHARQPVYYIPGYGVGIGVGAFVAGAVGVVLGWRSEHFGLVAVTMLAAGLTAVGLISSLAILALPVAVALVALAARLSQGRRHAVAASAAGLLLGLGLSSLALIALSQPLVDCEDGSGGENIFLGFESNSGSSSGSIGPGGRTSSGREQGDSYAYSYACRDGKLVEFDFRHR